LVLTDLEDIISAEAIECQCISIFLTSYFTFQIFLGHADIVTFPACKIGMIPFMHSDFYHFRSAEIGKNGTKLVSGEIYQDSKG
jgi:hypothetical protein